MKNILVYCNTYYQLLVAIQLKMALKTEDCISVILTDASKGAEEVHARLKAADFFSGVFFQKSRIAEGEAKAAYKFRTLWRCVWGSLPKDIPPSYICDELIGFNLDLPTHAVFAALLQRNPNMCCNVMEEGLLSYDTPESGNRLLRTIQRVRSLLGKKNLRQSVQRFYCFNPLAYKGVLEPVEIPRLDCQNAALRSLLQQVFLGERVLEPYRQRYIYLPCIYDVEGGAPIGEVALARVLLQQMGEENLLVKVHPRDDPGKYRTVGVAVDTNSSIPFEVLCILQDFSDKVLITTLSGSVLNVCALLEKPPISYYAYPLCDLVHNPMAQHFCGVISRYLSPESGLDVPNIRLLTNISQMTK